MKKKQKLRWWYYSVHHGPGHQSGHDGFFSSDELIGYTDGSGKITSAVIDEYFERKFRDYDYPICDYWEVEKPSHRYLEDKREVSVALIEGAEQTLRQLKGIKSNPTSMPGFDEEVGKLLQDRPYEDHKRILEKLHKNGIMVEGREFRRWIENKKWSSPLKPKPSIRDKVIKIIKSVRRKKK